MGRKSLYSTEYRAEAVRLWRESGLTFNKVAADLGIPSVTLRGWARAIEAPPPPHRRRTVARGVAGGGPPAGPLTGDERSEPVELRRRVRILETEREILREAAAFFAQESERAR